MLPLTEAGCEALEAFSVQLSILILELLERGEENGGMTPNMRRVSEVLKDFEKAVKDGRM